jgi:hypothetical protein
MLRLALAVVLASASAAHAAPIALEEAILATPPGEIVTGERANTIKSAVLAQTSDANTLKCVDITSPATSPETLAGGIIKAITWYISQTDTIVEIDRTGTQPAIRFIYDKAGAMAVIEVTTSADFKKVESFVYGDGTVVMTVANDGTLLDPILRDVRKFVPGFSARCVSTL